MSTSNDIKIASTQNPVADLIRNRWSARSFSEKQISENDLDTILEAASWAASANNEQPWLYYSANKSSDAFNKIVDALAGGNQPWAKNAAAFIISVARTTFSKDNSPNAIALHDVGQANATLLLQASALGIHTHPMGGFNAEKIKTLLQLNEIQQPVIVIALGYLDEAEKLVEPFKTRELTARSRKPFSEFVTKL